MGEPIETTDWKALIESAAWALVEQARAIDPECIDASAAEAMLATTLVCAVLEAQGDGSSVAYVVNVGDSSAWRLCDAGFEQVKGGKAEAEGGISSSAVSGLPRVPIDVIAARVELSPSAALLIGTDGFGDPLGSGTGAVGQLFAEVLQSGPPSMIEFGHTLDFSRETFDDDRTLVSVWNRSQATSTA